MPLLITDQGRNNRCEIDSHVLRHSEGSITFDGSHNHVEIGADCLLIGARIRLGERCSFRVGRKCRLAALETMAIADGHITIGEASHFTWISRMLLHEAGRIDIGGGALIGDGTLFTISDMHSIIDRKTGERLNPAADIRIGDDVWLAYAVTILKGALVGDGSVVGLGSIVTGPLPAHSLSAGRPARVVREDVSWNRDLL